MPSDEDRGLLHYFASLPQIALDKLYDDEWTCQGLLRSLPALARLYALRLVLVSAEEGGMLPEDVVSSWPTPTHEGRGNHATALNQLRRLRLLVEEDTQGKRWMWLHRSFARQLRNSLSNGSVAADAAGAAGSGAADAAVAAASGAGSGGVGVGGARSQNENAKAARSARARRGGPRVAQTAHAER